MALNRSQFTFSNMLIVFSIFKKIFIYIEFMFRSLDSELSEILVGKWFYFSLLSWFYRSV